MSIPGMRILHRCGFKTEFSLWSCDLDRGHAGPHKVPWDPRLPANLTREEQEAFRGGLLEDILERPHRRRDR
jgi:hypothetical protein